MKNNKYVSLVVLGSLVLAVPALAQMPNNTSPSIELRDGRGGMMNWGRMMVGMHFGVIGTVASVNDTAKTITVTSNKIGWGKDGQDQDEDNQNGNTPKTTPTPITYTVDASKATIIKAGVASTISEIAVGDMVIVQGTVTDTNIVATAIRDGVNKNKDKDKDKETKTSKPEITPLIQGNGQPIIAGVVATINGTTLTITNKSGITYTVDVSNAKTQNDGALSTFSTIAIGDNVVVQGTVNGTNVVAYSIIDQGSTPRPSIKPNDKGEARGNFFGGIGRFFQRLFGF